MKQQKAHPNFKKIIEESARKGKLAAVTKEANEKKERLDRETECFQVVMQVLKKYNCRMSQSVKFSQESLAPDFVALVVSN